MKEYSRLQISAERKQKQASDICWKKTEVGFRNLLKGNKCMLQKYDERKQKQALEICWKETEVGSRSNTGCLLPFRGHCEDRIWIWFSLSLDTTTTLKETVEIRDFFFSRSRTVQGMIVDWESSTNIARTLQGQDMTLTTTRTTTTTTTTATTTTTTTTTTTIE